MPFYFVQCREFLKSQFNQAWVLPLLWGTISFKAINFSWGCVHFTVFFPPWINNNNKNRIISQHLTYTLLKHLISDPLNILLYAQASLICYCQRHLEQVSSRRMLRLWYHSQGPQEPHKSKLAVPSNRGPSFDFDCGDTTPKIGAEVWLFVFDCNASSVTAVSIRAASGQKRHWAVQSYKVLFQCHRRAQTGAHFGSLKRPQYWALKMFLNLSRQGPLSR